MLGSTENLASVCGGQDELCTAVAKCKWQCRAMLGARYLVELPYLASYWTTLLVLFLYRIRCPQSLHLMTSVFFKVFSAPAACNFVFFKSACS